MRYLLIALLLISAAAQAATLNPKAVSEMTATINLGGTLTVTGNVQTANLSLHIPQKGVDSLVVTGADSWEYVNDAFGNKLLLLKWTDPGGSIAYNVKISARSAAKKFSDLGSIGSDPEWLRETETIVFNDDIRRMAFPYEKTWERVAKLTTEVNKLVEYDINFVGQRKSSEWVLENKRGVCVEHANLLAALLRASGIPTRYVVGYAYSTVDDKLIGHTWVEVLNSRGEWVPFDPTWLEGGYVDATHIATAYLLDDNQVDTLNYYGNGKIEWEKSEENFEISTQNLTRDRVDIINYKLTNVTAITADDGEFSQGEYGFVKARIENDGCSIVDLTASSCVDERERKIFDVYDSSRSMWFCGSQDVYWFFSIRDSQHNSYICPVSVYDQIGSSDSAQIGVSGRNNPPDIAISGPDKVGINEKFSLAGEGLLYSPDFGVVPDQISLNEPGNYRFYLYLDGALATKDVEAVENRQFTLLVKAPLNTTVNASFIADVIVKNLGPAKTATVKLHFDDKTAQQTYNFAANEEKTFQFNVTAQNAGLKKINAEVIADSLESYTKSILVKETPKNESVLDSVLNAIRSGIMAIVDFFRGLFNVS